MAIYKVDNEFVISSNKVWRPGVFNSKKAAHYARLFTDEQLSFFGVKTISFQDLEKVKNGNI